MSMSVEQIEKNDLEILKKLRTHDQFQDKFGCTKLQRHLKIGYNRSYRLIENGIQAGILIVQGKSEYRLLVSFNE